MESLNLFFEVSCLTERSSQLSGIELQKKVFKSADKRYIGVYLQKFIDYNSDLFDFLGVNPYIIGSDQSASIIFKTSEFIGTIPLRAPDTGKQIGDFVVSPRFSGNNRYKDYIEILEILNDDIGPEVIHSLPLLSGRNFRPPLYLEALKFISSLEKLVKLNWRKFDSKEFVSNQPTGNINWSNYINNSYKVENRLNFRVRKSYLSEYHSEYSELRHVYDLCKLELFSSKTPLSIKNSIAKKINYLDSKLYFQHPKLTLKISIKNSDSSVIKDCKVIANKILNFELIEGTAWRVDFANVFEKFVQHIFKEVAFLFGGKFIPNLKIVSKTNTKYQWRLNNLEPDGVLLKDDIIIFVDAKYKSHLYNKYAQSETLKEDHRRDLHQILSYSSFNDSRDKISFLCYPSNKIEFSQINYQFLQMDFTNQVILMGIPFKKEVIVEAKIEIIKFLEILQNTLTETTIN